jgi:hypothetical protein
VTEVGQNLSFTDSAGTTLTGSSEGSSFTVSGTTSEPVPGTSCVLTDTITWNGTFTTTLNFSGAGTEFIVSNNPAFCAGFVSCTANESLVGTRVTPFRFEEFRAGAEAARLDQLLLRLKIPQVP